MKTLLLFADFLRSVLSAETAFQVKVSGHGQPMILIPGLSSGGGTWIQPWLAIKATAMNATYSTLAGFAGAPPIKF